MGLSPDSGLFSFSAGKKRLREMRNVGVGAGTKPGNQRRKAWERSRWEDEGLVDEQHADTGGQRFGCLLLGVGTSWPALPSVGAVLRQVDDEGLAAGIQKRERKGCQKPPLTPRTQIRQLMSI